MELFILVVWFAACAIQDARQRQISNGLTFGAITLTLVYILITGRTWLGAPASEGGIALLIALGLTVPGYVLGKLGAGDLKLLAGLALATDRLVLLGTFVGASVVMVAWVVVRQKLLPHRNQGVTESNIHSDSCEPNKHPFAPFLFSGFILFMLAFHQP